MCNFRAIFAFLLLSNLLDINPRNENLTDFAKIATKLPFFDRFSKFEVQNEERGWGYLLIILKLQFHNFKQYMRHPNITVKTFGAPGICFTKIGFSFWNLCSDFSILFCKLCRFAKNSDTHKGFLLMLWYRIFK